MSTKLDELNFISESGRKYLRFLAQEIAFGSVVLFAGAGLSCNAVARDGKPNRMPRWRELAELLRGHLDQDLQGNTDPLKIADYFETKLGRAALTETVRNAIQDMEHEPGHVHQIITRLNFEEIITTNYDTLLERAFAKQFIDSQVVVDGQDLVAKRCPPRIIKMHGCLKLKSSGLVVTGSDFLAYAEKHPWVQIFVTQTFVQSTVLFIGFGLNDPAFQAINERVLSMLGRDKARLAFSLQHGASKTEVEFWKKRQVQIIDLYSGETEKFDDQVRIQRVLDALLEFQKEQTRWPQRRKREALVLPAASTKSGVQDVVLSALRLLGGVTDDSDLEALRTGGAGRILYLCAERVFADQKSLPDLRSVLRELVLWLKQICRMDDIESPGIQLAPEHWAPIRELTYFLLDFQPREDSENPLDSVLLLNLRVLAALLSLKLMIVAPRLAVEAARLPKDQLPCEERSPSLARRTAADRFLKALDGLSLSCLTTQDMQIRSRLIAMLSFFGRLEDLSTMVTSWGNDGVTAAERDQPTPEEYRLLPLSFYGILKRRRSLYQEAAESLWSRQLVNESPARGWRIESAFRYRYLRRAAPGLEDWMGVRLQGERLARVLGQLELNPEPADTEERNSSFELLATLQEINRGWMFGCPPPGAVERAWEWAEDKSVKGEAAEVPWEALAALTLPIEGGRLFEQRQDLMRDAWRFAGLDARFFVEYLVRRIGDGTFETLAADLVQVEDSPFGCYEYGMAQLVRWLAERIPFERRNGELLEALEEKLLSSRDGSGPSPLARWLCQTRYPEVRSRLLDALLVLRPYTSAAVDRLLRTWVAARLRQPPQSSSLQLSVLDPSPVDLAIEPHEIRILMAHAQARQTAGTQFRNDFLKWLVRWAEQDKLDSLVLVALARQILEILSEERDQSIDWLPLVAEVRPRPGLYQIVEDQLRHGAASPTDLFGHVKTRLGLLPSPQSRTLQEKGVLLKFFTPFAEDFDETMSSFVDISFASEMLGPEARNDAVELLAALLQRAPQDLRERSAENWRTALSRLIQQGAIGRGLSREQIAELAPATRQALQDNLIGRLARDGGSEPPRIVAGLIEQIEEKVGHAVAEPLTDLEQELIRSFQSRDETLSLFSLNAVVRLCQECPDFLERNRTCIHRIRLFVEKRNGYRTPSRFSELLDELRQIEEQPPQQPGIGARAFSKGASGNWR